MLVAIISSTLVLGACIGELKKPTTEHSTSTFIGTNKLSSITGLKGSQGIQLGSDWLLASENKGIIKWDGHSQKVEVLNTGEYKYLQSSNELVVTLDIRADRIQTFEINGTKLNKIEMLPEIDYEINWICIQPRAQDGLNYVWLGGESGQAQQWLLGKNSNWSPRLVRSVSVPMGTLNCSLDTTTETLYVVEQQAGIWAIDAHPQAVKETELAVSKPHNNLTAVYANNGNVFYQNEFGEIFQNDQQIAQNKGAEVEGLTISTQHNVSSILSFDDNKDQYLLSKWQLKLQKQPKKPLIREIPAWAESASSDRAGDTMDDPAIWVNHKSPAESLILGTHKRWGLLVFDMKGNQIQSIGTGRINNIDIRQGVEINGETKDIAIASLRDGDRLAVYEISKSGHVTQAALLDTHLKDIYGMCLYQDKNDLYAFANEKSGKTIQYKVNFTDKYELKKVRELSIPTQVEGCVANDKTQQIYIGEENVGIWKFGARPIDQTKGELIIKEGGPLVADVEGLALYHGKNNTYLVASSQGNDSYIIYQSEAPYDFVTQFRIGTNFDKGIDGSSETDGLAVTSMSVGKGAWAKGMLVVQDGRNRMPDANQSFKWIPWSPIFNNLM